MPDYRVDLLNPDDAERLVIWLNRTRALNVAMPAEGRAVVTFNQAAFDWLTDQDAEATFCIDLGLGGKPQLWIDGEEDFPAQRVTS